MSDEFNARHALIDQHAERAQLEIAQMALFARYQIASIVQRHNRSIAQQKRWELFHKINGGQHENR